MDFKFCMQDPTDPATRYLYEAIISAAAEATSMHGMFAFVSRNGIDHLIEDQVIQDLMKRGGQVDLIVGIDAVTNLQSLERLLEFGRRYHAFHPKVFWNGSNGLFHPKISHFGYADGRKKLIVGSGNLTPGGLMHNFEGYSVITSGVGEVLDVSSLDDFLVRHAADIRDIDQDALDRAALNVLRPLSGGTPRPRVRPRPPAPVPRPAPVRPPVLDRILIAQVPRASGRWSQAHFNKDIVEQFFRITDRETQRAYLTRIDAGGVRGEEEVRRCVYSTANKNYKIEIGAAKHRDYPDAGVPVLVFRERQVRVFDYMLLFPGDPGHAETLALSERLPAIGRGHRRVIIDVPTLAAAWPACPLLAEAEAVVEL
jgi:HKD family nuclease